MTGLEPVTTGFKVRRPNRWAYAAFWRFNVFTVLHSSLPIHRALKSQVPGDLPLRRMLKVRIGIDRQISFILKLWIIGKDLNSFNILTGIAKSPETRKHFLLNLEFDCALGFCGKIEAYVLNRGLNSTVKYILLKYESHQKNENKNKINK